MRAEVCMGAASPKARILPPAAFAPNARMLPPTFFFLLSTVTVKPILPIVGAGIYDSRLEISGEPKFWDVTLNDAAPPSVPVASVAACDP